MSIVAAVWAAQSAILTASDTSLAGAVRALADSIASANRASHSAGLSMTDILGIVGALTAVVTIIVGLVQYARAQRVDRAKLAMEATRTFEQDPYVRNAQWMLDWNGRDIALWPDGDAEPPVRVGVTHDLLANALRTTNLQFTDEEMAIRDTFDRFFDQLGRFERLLSDRLIADYNLKPYLGYWCNLLGGHNPEHQRVYRGAVRQYLVTYGFQDALGLIDRFAARKPTN